MATRPAVRIEKSGAEAGGGGAALPAGEAKPARGSRVRAPQPAEPMVPGPITQLPTLLSAFRDDLTVPAVPDWQAMATVPHRLAAFWLETHLRLVETTVALA